MTSRPFRTASATAAPTTSGVVAKGGRTASSLALRPGELSRLSVPDDARGRGRPRRTGQAAPARGHRAARCREGRPARGGISRAAPRGGPRGRRDRARRAGDFDEAAARTEQAMRDGADVIYQAIFSRDGWRGLADFVIRVDEPSDLGDWSYEAWDTKLARSAKPAAVLQLVFYSQEIGRDPGPAARAAARRSRHRRRRDLPARRLRRLLPHRAAAAARAPRRPAATTLPLAVRPLLALRLHPGLRASAGRTTTT